MPDIASRARRHLPRSRVLIASWCLGLALILSIPAEAREPWYPVEVHVWDPPFNSERQRVDREYRPLDHAAEPWRVCMLIPHLKDAYWLTVNFALVDEARRLGVAVAVFTAGGYEYLDRQREQIGECLDQNPDGILLGAVSLDGLNDLIETVVDRGIPVIDLINGVSSPRISARVGVDFWDMGQAAGAYLNKLQEQRATPIRAAWFPGPDGAGWVEASDAGFRDAVSGRPIEIITSMNGDTGRAAQTALVETALEQYPGQIDYLVGTAVTAEAAVSVVRKRQLKDRVGLLADYYSPGVHRAIRRGEVIAAPSDLPGLQTRIALDTMVRMLEGREFSPHVAAKVVLIDREKLSTWDPSAALPPRGFRPVFNVDWQ